MFYRMTPMVMLVAMVVLIAAACGGGDEEEAAPAVPAAAAPTQEPTPAPPAVTAEPTDTDKQGYKGGPVPVDALAPVDLSKEGDVVDLTVKMHDGTTYVYGTPPFRYEPKDMTFRVGQTVNFTLEFADTNSRYKHTFTSQALGLDEKAAYGQSTTFTYTFDKPGVFFVHDSVVNPMTGTITVVE